MKDVITANIQFQKLYNEQCVKDQMDMSILNESTAYAFFSRLFDICVSSVGLILAIPLVIIFGSLVKLEDGGPIIYTQERVGRYGRIFTIYKIRSMRIDAEKNGAQWAQSNDSRVLKVGKFIRKTRIDEIPQLINILKGDMSIIGPRPERPIFTMEFNEEIDGFINRLLVKPGLTGWAQVNGGYEMTPEEKLNWDLDYIKNRNIVMDIKILLKTVEVVLTGEGAR